MAITQTRIEEWVGTAGPTTGDVTTSFSPVANRLYLFFLTSVATSVNPDPTISGGGLSWDVVVNLSFNTLNRIKVFRAMSASPTSGAVTMSWGSDFQDQIWWAAYEFSGTAEASVTNGAGAIVQSRSNSNSGATGITLDMSPLANAQNAVFATLLHQSFNETGTPNGGWAQTRSFGNSAGTAADVFKIGGTDPGDTWSDPTVNGIVAVEISIPITTSVARYQIRRSRGTSW